MSDYIDRRAAKLAIVEEGQRSKRYKLGEFWELNRDEAWDAIDGVPSEDVEPVRRGRWKTAMLDHEAFGERSFIYYCSKCCQCVVSETTYCPNCGARMDGEEE